MKTSIALRILLLVSLVGAAAQEKPIPLTDYYRNRATDTNLPVKERIAAYDSLIRHDNRLSLLLDKIHLMNQSGMTKQALPLLDSIWEIRDKMTASLRCRTMKEMVHSSSMTYNYPSAWYVANELLSMDKPDSLAYYNVGALKDLASISLEIDDYPTAEATLKRAEKELDKVEWPSEAKRKSIIGAIYGTKTQLLVSQKRYKEAYRELENMLKMPLDTDHIVGAYINMGQIFEAQGDNEIAREYFKKALEMPGQSANRHIALLALAYRTLLDIGPQEAYELMSDNIELLANGSSAANEFAAITTYASIVAHLGDFHLAYELLCKAKSERDSIFVNRTRLLSDNSRRQIAMLDEARRDGRMKRRYMVVAGIFAAVAAGLTFWTVRERRRRYGADRRAESCEAESRSLTAEIQSLRAVIADQQKALDHAQSRAAEVSLAYTSARETLSHIGEITESDRPMAARNEAVKRELRNLSLHDRLLRTESLLRDIADPVFTGELSRRFPTLTKGEIEMCLLIRQGYTSRQIADLTSRSVRTVEVIRHNIRRKIAPVDLSRDYLNSITIPPLSS